MATIVAVFTASLAGWASHENLSRRVEDLRATAWMMSAGDWTVSTQKFETYDTRLTTLEERTSPFRR
jgi:hypothetical protein